ncbi:glycosyltransferase [Algoriphagus sediminis]|uniref:Glycosyltransferase n=1 Tax=Algoriphagus sediminis TaxID=3057113 RepID=A0ABT7Y9D9_9BACT|nr:glycosyltransferase [Algoriphagus sediminis]MDN3203040.1 glycosyltransferase [Algoriphagus sediminis]
MMLFFYAFLCLGYFGLLLWMAFKWQGKQGVNSLEKSLSVSLIIPCRNEEKNVQGLLEHLFRLDYEDLEIILVDDQSEDRTYDLISAAINGKAGFQLISNSGFGKKEALMSGVKIAKGEIILTSDADCQVHPEWVKEMVIGFSDTAIQLVAGPVLPEYQGHAFSFELIEWASILLTTQVSFEQGNPLMCSAANLAYRKSAFQKVEGFKGNLEEPSGDDEFLLKKVVEHFGNHSVKYQVSDYNLVLTKPYSSLKSLISQRVRWAGKWSQNKDFVHRLTAISSALLQIIWLASFIFLFSGALTFTQFLLIWAIKILGEFLALRKVLQTFDLKPAFWHYVFTGLIHPVFVLGVVGRTFSGKIEWKGREINRNPNFV